ncbi:peptidoglycan-recognition protein 3-like [Macrosteles quadrilineatus]|uniref:peptidoglycan-recognition protein 3-like n=1 Tax=Macrosteles quadrilineatus TaxID=74068 RepID=UPI0023E1FC0B|nr:peptidoglycan-recognition protein 3-like [Macrosteles quadrilineatus]
MKPKRPFYNVWYPDYWPGEVEEEDNYKRRVVARHEWGAKKPRSSEGSRGLMSSFCYRYTDTDQCRKPKDCKKIVLDVQISHMRQGYPDIQYSYLIGGDDNFYEGAGWRTHVKDILSPHGEREDETPSLIFAYIGRQEEISKDKLWMKHMEKQGFRLLSWLLENRLIDQQTIK